MEKINQRLLSFIESKGGITTVSDTLGKKPQIFYNIKNRGTLPSITTMTELKAAYPDLDMEWLYTGVYSEKLGTMPEISLTDIEKENEQLKEGMAELKQQLADMKRNFSSMETSFKLLRFAMKSRMTESEIKELNFPECRQDSTVKHFFFDKKYPKKLTSEATLRA